MEASISRLLRKTISSRESGYSAQNILTSANSPLSLVFPVPKSITCMESIICVISSISFVIIIIIYTSIFNSQVEVSHRAQERIVESNVGLVVMMARRHHPKIFADLGVTRDDIIQEGSMALLRAAETFDPNMGCRFATYAGWWVRDGVQRCVSRQARLIRLPQHGESTIVSK